MSNIDPVEFGEMKSNITHTMNTVGDIKTMLETNFDRFDSAQDTADKAHGRIDTIEAVRKTEVAAESKHRKKMGFVYGAIATVAGSVASLVKWIFE